MLAMLSEIDGMRHIEFSVRAYLSHLQIPFVAESKNRQ